MTIHYRMPQHHHGGLRGGSARHARRHLGRNPGVDETGTNGRWDFDAELLVGSIGMVGGKNNEERTSVFNAVEKQLGLRWNRSRSQRPCSWSTQRDRKPSENPPGTRRRPCLCFLSLPNSRWPASQPTAVGAVERMSRYQRQPCGRLLVEGMPLQFLIRRAFNVNR